MKKILTILAIAIGVIIIIAVAIVLTLPLTINPLVKNALDNMGPKILGVPVSVQNVALKPLAGAMTVSGLKIGNPEGYSEQVAFAVEQIDVKLELKSLFTQTIIINEILIDSPSINFELRRGIPNFKVILDHAKAAGAQPDKPAEADADDVGKKEKKMIISLFCLRNCQVSMRTELNREMPIKFTLPELVLRDLGKKENGISSLEAIVTMLTELVVVLGKQIGQGLQQFIEMPEAATDLLNNFIKSGKNATEATSDSQDKPDNADDKICGAVKTLFSLKALKSDKPAQVEEQDSDVEVNAPLP